MPRYGEERKEAVLAKLLPPHCLTVQQVAERENISEPTIYKWRHEAREQGRCFPDATTRTRRTGRPGTSSRRWLRLPP